jgi:tRNA(fMet)-specific endonuclease VapC
MKNLLFDTNILMLYIRKDPQWQTIFNKFDVKNTLNCLSVVSLGELYALSLRNEWGEKRIMQIELIKQNFTIVDINMEPIISRYADIDAFSQGKHPNVTSKGSARNMGKNDLWIAATASVYDLTLLTLDGDFKHLDSIFLELGSW